MPVDSAVNVIRERYQMFAEHEARNVSPLYEEFANSVAKNESVIHFLLALPETKQQPNLLLAAVRKHCGVAASGDEFCRFVLASC